MRLLERLVMPIVTRSPRQLFFLAVFLAWVAMQGITLNAIWASKTAEFARLSKFDSECVKINSEMPTAYASIEDECKIANLTVKSRPISAAFAELVNTTWPHPENVAKWTSAWLGSLSYVTIGVAVVLFWVCWPLVGPRLNIVKGLYNWGKEKKGKIEIEKLLEHPQLRNLLLGPGGREQLSVRVLKPTTATPDVVLDKEEEVVV